MPRYLENDDYKKMLADAKKLLQEKQTQLASLEQTYSALTKKPSTPSPTRIVYGDDYIDAMPPKRSSVSVKVPAGSPAARIAEEAKELLEARDVALANPLLQDPSLIRDPKTGLSPAQVEANKAVAETTKDAGFPKAGTILRYRGSKTGFRIPIYADGKGGEYEGSEQADPNYDSNKGDGGYEFVEYEYSKDFKKRRAKYFNRATGTFTYGEYEDAPLTKEDFDAQQANILAEERALNEKRDAFALIESTMRSYGFNEEELKELTTYIQGGLLNPKLGPEQLVLQLRQLPSYKARFAGNEERRARGLNALSEANYLLQESAYAETLRQYGLQRFVNRTQFATFIGNDISNTEVGRRVKTAVERLQMGDPAILRQLRSYYAITDSDIVSYFLNPKEVLPELESKVTTAEIGATAGQYGLDTGLARASDLERYGVDLERARRGYSNIAQVLPRTTTLSDIYKQAGIDYTQTTAEEEEFKGLASAKRARERLAGLETAAFSGASGATRGVSLSKQLGGTY